MGVFDKLGTQQQMDQRQMQQQMQQEIGRISAGPQAYLKNKGFNIPDGMNDPERIVKHLINSGQVGGPRAQLAQRLIQGMRLQ